MAIIRIKSESMDLSDDYTFTGTVEGAGGGIFESQLLHVRHELASGTNGGDSVVGINTQSINTVMTNEITGASLSSNQITLPSGTYYIDCDIASNGASKSQGYLYNVTDSSNEVIGNSGHANTGSPSILIKSRFTISAQKVFEIRFNAESAKTGTGLGAASSVTTEVYTDVKIWKVA